jgi:hypothetical protein
MAISGHRTRAIFDRYNITSEADILGAAVKLQAYLDEIRHSCTIVALEAPDATPSRVQ